MPTQATMKGVPVALLSGVTASGTSSAFAIPVTADNPQIELVGSGTLSTGTIIIEENQSDPAFSGTWSTLQSVTAASLTGGAAQVIHIFGYVRFIRVRMTGITGGGNVSANLSAQ